MTANASDLVAVVLSSRELPQVVKLSAHDRDAPSVGINGKMFVDTGAGDWLGFYDWLRTSQGLVVGVRQYIDDSSVFPFSREFMGVQTASRRVVCAFFSQQREFDESASSDQNFGDNRLLASNDAVAITFSALGFEWTTGR